MEKTIIVGVLTQLGIELCCRLLEDDVEVIGIDDYPVEDSIEEERMLMVGRNANFSLERKVSNFFEIRTEQIEDIEHVFYVIDHNEALLVNSNQSDTLLSKTNKFCADTKKNLVLLSNAGNRGDQDSSMDTSNIHEEWYNLLNKMSSRTILQEAVLKDKKFHFTYLDFTKIDMQEGQQFINEHIEKGKEYFEG